MLFGKQHSNSHFLIAPVLSLYVLREDQSLMSDKFPFVEFYCMV